MREVFISYSRKDLEEVKKMRFEIDREVGIDCWMDLNGIESGEQFEDVIIDAICDSKIVLFMMSANSMASPWALDELDFAKHENKRVVLVGIDDAEMTRKFYFKYHKYDTISWYNEPQRNKLIKNLKLWTQKSPLIEITTKAGELMKECQRISESTAEGLAFFAARNFTNLKIHGEMNARDFYFLKNFCTMLEYLDISDVKIKEFYGPYGTMHDFHGMDEIRDIQYEADEIPSGAFFYWIPKDEGMPSLREITLPENIVKIRRNAFARAYNLKNINIPKGVTSIGRWSFCCCSSLTEIEIPETVTEIERQAFTDSPLQVVHSKAKQPPVLDLEVFRCASITGERTLFVPKGSLKAYEESDWTQYFDEIIEE